MRSITLLKTNNAPVEVDRLILLGYNIARNATPIAKFKYNITEIIIVPAGITEYI